jgi:hypothetical protein
MRGPGTYCEKPDVAGEGVIGLRPPLVPLQAGVWANAAVGMSLASAMATY